MQSHDPGEPSMQNSVTFATVFTFLFIWCVGDMTFFLLTTDVIIVKKE